MDDNYKLEDTLTTIQSQLTELDRVVLRTALKGSVSGDTKRKVNSLLADIQRRFNSLPESN